MTNDGRFDELSEEHLQELHRICNQYEKSLRDKDGTTIESLIADVPSDLQRPLFLELLKLDIDFFAKLDKKSDIAEYLVRFPSLTSDIEQAFNASREQGNTPVSPETRLHDSDDPNSPQTATTDHLGIAVGVQIGNYKLLRPIGEGGMGSVWMAEQKKPVRRDVALKIIKAGMDTREVIARFEAERQALALMNHPNIAKVLDAGQTTQGRPYFVMELVKGIPITRFCDEHNLQTAQRLKLFNSVCRAVQHAHQKGIIHRDIKPSNVLVAMQDNEPVVKVIDFGLAKATGQSLTEKTMFTAFGQMVGTPVYMSPEQADAGGLDIDTRTDVYSLGVVLYELLAGVTPIDIKQLRSAGYAEIQRMIREQDPRAMSSRVSALGQDSQVIASNRSTDSKRLKKNLQGDLDLIVMKALEKDRNRRYESPSSFAADVDRFLNNEAIEARPASAVYRLKKLVRRNKTAVFASSAIALALLLGTVVSVWQAVRATNARDAEIRQRELATEALAAESLALDAEKKANDISKKRLDQLEKINDVIGSVFRDLDPKLEENGGPPLRAQLVDRMDEVSDLIEGEAIGDPLMVAALQFTLGIAQNNLGDAKKARELLQKSLESREAELGKDHTDTNLVLAELAENELATGDYPKAKANYERAYLAFQKLLGPEDPSTLKCMSFLADTHNRIGERQKGLDLQTKAFEIATNSLGLDHETTMEILFRLAGQNFDYNDPQHDQVSKKLYSDHLAQRIKNNGPQHYTTIQARLGLARVALALGDKKEAIDLYQAVLDGTREKLGEGHAASIVAKCSLAYAYCQADQPDVGLEILAASVPRLGIVLGEEHPKHMMWLNLLAYSYEQNDDLDNAIKFHKEALKLRASKLGEDNPATLSSIGNLGWCCRRAKKFDEAVEHYLRGLPGMRKSYPADHASLIGYLNNLGQSLYQARQFKKAEPILRECIPLLEKALGGTKDGWKSFRARFWLGDSLRELERFDEAETELLAAYEGMLARKEKIKSKDRFYINDALDALTNLYTKRDAEGDKAKVEKMKALKDAYDADDADK